MLSQYSWGDFIKFVIVLAVPYYAYVLWKYYREDIRDWISNRGNSPQPAAATSSDEDEADEDEAATGLYAVKSYSNAQSNTEAGPAPDVRESRPTQPAPVPAHTSVQREVDIPEGVVIGDESEHGFELALVAEVVRPAERSLAEVINAAQRVSSDDRGVLSPVNPDDVEASEVATVINQQNGLSSVLSGVAFKR